MGVLNEGYRKARKPHRCDGWYWIEDYSQELGLGLCDGIKKGDTYYFQTNTFDGLGTFKCCEKCNEQAKTHNLSMCEEN